MQNAPHIHTTQRPRDLFRHMALPFFLFFLVLTVLLFLSWIFILPILAHADVQGESVDVRHLITYRKQLQAEVTDVRHERDELVLPGQEPLYRIFKQEKQKKVPFSALRKNVLDIAHTTSATDDVVRVSFFKYDTAHNALLIEGEVFAGTQSRAVLAEFVDALQALPWIYDIEQPSFDRGQNDDGEFFSPFSLRISLDVSALREIFPVL